MRNWIGSDRWIVSWARRTAATGTGWRGSAPRSPPCRAGPSPNSYRGSTDHLAGAIDGERHVGDALLAVLAGVVRILLVLVEVENERLLPAHRGFRRLRRNAGLGRRRLLGGRGLDRRRRASLLRSDGCLRDGLLLRPRILLDFLVLDLLDRRLLFDDDLGLGRERRLVDLRRLDLGLLLDLLGRRNRGRGLLGALADGEVQLLGRRRDGYRGQLEQEGAGFLLARLPPRASA